MNWLGTPMARAVTPAATLAASMFGIINEEPARDATNEQKIKAIEKDKDDDTVIQTIANTAAEKTAIKAKLNRTLTNYLNDIRNSIPNETLVAAPVVPAVLPTDLTHAVAKATIGEINDNLELDNALSTKESSEAVSQVNASILQEENDLIIDEIKKSMQAIIASQGNITKFREECVEEAVKQFRQALTAYSITITPKLSEDIMKQIAESWSEFLISSTTPDSSIYLSVKTFFFRVNQAIDALLTQCIFLSTKWNALQTAQPPPPVFSFPLMSTSGYPISYSKVNVGPCWYTIGPILDFQNIEGRIFIYVKCYLTEQSTDGIYFWVYRSQSEGFYRVFFKLDPFGAIEKGFDYTQGTFDDCRLQMALCNYYDIHYKQGIKNPIKVDTLTRLNYFMSQMPYLQASNFLDNFPGEIKPSFYSRISEKLYERATKDKVESLNKTIVAAKCTQHGDKDNCCYVCLTQGFESTSPPTKIPGMIGHYYTIDYSFRFIIRKGFPLYPPNMSDSDWLGVVNMYCIKQKVDFKIESERKKIIQALKVECETQCALYFPEEEGTPVKPNYRLNYEFSRRKMGYGTTCPYIFCFTTCGLIQSCPMFKLFLSANSYKTTFWCQGFQNYTAMLSVPNNREILSPVLYVVIGALLQDADMRLSTLRNIILNIGIMSDARLMSQEFYKATKALMTLGTRNFGDPDTSLYLPNIPIRSAALLAFKNIRDKTNEIYESFKKKNNSPSVEDKKIVHLEVQKKIIMIKILAARLLGQPPEKMTLFSQEMQKLCGVASHDELLEIQAIKTAASESTIVAFGTSISTSDVAVFTSDDNHEKYYTDAQTNATNFIEASPEAAAAALFGYISSPKKLVNEPTEFEKDLTHFALLCLKKEWIRGIMDDAYHALEGVFNPENAIHNYLGIDGEFHQFVPAPPTPPPPPPPTPPPTPDPYVFISSFDEVRKEDTSPTSPDKNADYTTTELNVTVVTFAHIYRVDCGYHEVFADGSHVFKSMSILYQISTTIVYTREVNPRILYAMNHRTPLVCLPDVFKNLGTTTEMNDGTSQTTPDAKKESMPKNTSYEKKGRITITSYEKKGRTPNNPLAEAAVAAVAAAVEVARGLKHQKTKKQAEKLRQKQAEELRQKQAEELLTSPHTLCATYKRVAPYGALFAGKMMEYFFGGENGYYQLPYFFKNFDKFLKVCHQYDSTALMYLPDVPPYDLLRGLVGGSQLLLQSIESYFPTLGITFQAGSIQTKLEKNTKDIEAISEYLTKDFMPKPIDSGSSTPDSFTSVSTASSTSSTASRRDKDLDELLPYFKDIDKQNLYFLVFGFPSRNKTGSSQDSLSSQDTSWSNLGDSQKMDLGKGGTLPIKYHIKKSITTRKNKNKSRTKSKTPVRRITIRIKRMMKSKVTKPKTYKRRATGGNRKSKPNKTMRRYRRVRK